MINKLQKLENRFEELKLNLSDPENSTNAKKIKEFSKEFSDLTPIIEKFVLFKKVEGDLQYNKELLKESDSELVKMAEEELKLLLVKRDELAKELTLLLVPKDPRDSKNTILEIRAGTGGDEAALFVAALFRMYLKFSESKNWKTEILSSNPTGIGGFREIIVSISGKDVYSALKYEGGVHRVQRIPATESQGRIHTSTVTVAVLAEADDVEITIEEKDLKFDVYRSSGPGGQSVNTTDSAVRVTHLPTGLVVTCQDEKSQHKNKSKALKVLKARLLELETQKQADKIASDRKTMVGSGDRSERIRTYNFPQGRISDHRIGFTSYKLDSYMEGELDEMIQQLIIHFQTKAFEEKRQEDNGQNLDD